MPLKVSHRGHIDEDVLASLGKEPFPPHLYLISFGWMLHDFDHHYSKEGTHKTEQLLNNVDDKPPQDEGPCLEEGERVRNGKGKGEGGGGGELKENRS